MYNIYRYKGEPVLKISPYRLPSRTELMRFHPSIKKLRAHSLFPYKDIKLFMEAEGKYRIIYIKDRNRNIIHYSYVLPYIKRYPFAKRGDLIISRSWTSKNYRDAGIFAFTLRYILKRYGSENRNVYAVFSEKNNYLKGELYEIGFSPYKKARKSLLGKYKVLR